MLIPVLLLAACAAVTAWLIWHVLGRGASWWARLAGGRTSADLALLFVFIEPHRMVVATLVLAAALGAVAYLLRLPLPAVALLIAGALALPRLALHLLRARWRTRLARQLPDALTLWAGLLRAGQGTTQGLTQVAARQAPPLGNELALLLAQLRLGVSLEQAVAGLCERAAMADLRLLGVLLATHRDVGGNLAEPLQRLAELLRGRLLMQERIRSLTAQGRLQGIVVGMLPLLLLGVLYVMEPAAMRVLHTTWQGGLALGAIAFLEILGFLLIRRIVRIDA